MNTRTAIFLIVAIGLSACSGRTGTKFGSGNQGRDGATDSRKAAESPYDLQFLDTMILHHQGTIEMASLVRSRAQHDDLRQFSRKLIAQQQDEIEKMQGWRVEWYGDAPKAANMQFPGMSDGMSLPDTAKLDQLKANAFDLEFLGQMIPHHEAALAVARDAVVKGSNDEIKALARRIIQDQETEIASMKQWQEAWK